MGRNKLPDAIKQLRGTNQPCRQNNDKMLANATSIEVPTSLKGNAKKIYIEKANQLLALGILSFLDNDQLLIYSNAMDAIIKAQQNLNKDGFVVYVKDEEGHIIGQQENVWFKIQKESIKVANQIAVQFGFTPVSRTKIVTNQSNNEKDEFAEYEEVK